MSFYTHWACFGCRKSFAKEPSENPRKCPECVNLMIDMGVYFEPPKRQSKKRWEIMKLLAENGYKFQTEGSKSYIESFILRIKNPRIEDVFERIKSENRQRQENYFKQRKLVWETTK